MVWSPVWVLGVYGVRDGGDLLVIFECNSVVRFSSMVVWLGGVSWAGIVYFDYLWMEGLWSYVKEYQVRV